MDNTYIAKIKSMVEAKEYIEEVVNAYKPEEVLCLFDIDQTILEPQNPAARVPNLLKNKETFSRLKLKYTGFTPNNIGFFFVFDEQQVVDENIFDLLNFLNENNIKNLAFTATPNTFIEGKEVREIRYQQLKEKNISFEKNFPEQEVIFDSLDLFRGHPCFYKGIIFSNGEVHANKGIVLREFLKKINYQPKCIIFLDDTLNNHIDINQTLASSNPEIDFYGVYFTGAQYAKCPEVSKEEFEQRWEDYFHRESLECKKIERRKFNF